MTTQYYRNLVLKHWRLPLLFSLLMAGGAALGSLFVVHYQSTATVQVVIPSSDSSSSALANQTLQTEDSLATSDSILAQVVVHYPGLTAAQLKSEVTTAIAGNLLLKIFVIDRDPARAAHLANDLAAALITQQAQTMQQANARSQQPLLDALATTRKQIAADTATLNSLSPNDPANQQQIQQLQSELNSLQQQYNQELQTLTDVQSEEARTTISLQVVEAAQPSNKPLGNHLYLIVSTAAGLGLGLLLGVSLVLLRDWLDQQIRTAPALSELSGWPVLAELDIPASETVSAQGSAVQEEPRQRDPYRLLSQKLAFLDMEAPLFSIVVTSTRAESETANVVAGDLSLFLARGGGRVVLVDANFYRPSQDRRFGTPAEPGLGAAALAFSTSHAAEESLKPYLYPASDAPSLLRVLPAGPIPPNPKRVLRSRAVRKIFRAFGKIEADMVVLASPPVTGSADTCALAALADGVIVVVDLAYASKQKIMRMKWSLEEAGARVLGLVACRATLSQSVPSEQPGGVEGAPIS